MSSESMPWRAILWVERFLPKATVPSAEQSAKAKRRAAFVPLLVIPATVVPTIIREGRVIGVSLRYNVAVFEQVMLVAAGCIAIAAVAFGVKAWLDVRSAH